MSEITPSPKKMVSRNVAIALGIVCIVVIACLAGAFAYYVNDKNNTISALNSQISEKNNQISGLNATVTNLNNTVGDLNEIVNLNKSEVAYDYSSLDVYPHQGLDLPATFIDNPHAVIGSYALCYFENAGYLVVQINSTSNDTYINYTCTSHLDTFSIQTDIGLNGTAIFPVLPLAWAPVNPSEGIFMTVSTHTAVQAKINITATYYY